MPSSTFWANSEMPSTLNKSNTTKFTMLNKPNALPNSNSEEPKSLMLPPFSETHKLNWTLAKHRKSELQTTWKSMNKEPSRTRNTWESLMLKDNKKKLFIKRDNLTTLMPWMLLKKLKISLPQSSEEMDHSLNLAKSAKACYRVPWISEHLINMLQFYHLWLS
jgi:hypothetical protein